MLSRERVFESIAHREPDRVPLYCWVFRQPGVIDDIEAKYGNEEAFYDALSLDMCQTFPSKGLLKSRPPRAVDYEESSLKDSTYGDMLTVQDALDCDFTDPDDSDIYIQIRNQTEHHKGRCGRAIFLQTNGVFEASNGFLGLQNHLMAMIESPDLLTQFYNRIANWNKRFIDNALEIGVDVIHVSDDWGMNERLLFPPSLWRELIYPAEKITVDHAKSRGALVSLHCDGDFTSVLDGVVELGFDIAHPVQVSAGMDQQAFKQKYGNCLTLYGGLDVRETLGRNRPDQLEGEIRWLMENLKPGGGFIFCTSHMVQPGTPLAEVEGAFQLALELSWYR